jgi:hypothetical protein
VIEYSYLDGALEIFFKATEEGSIEVKSERPNRIFNLSCLAITIFAFATTAPAKTMVKTALDGWNRGTCAIGRDHSDIPAGFGAGNGNAAFCRT